MTSQTNLHRVFFQSNPEVTSKRSQVVQENVWERELFAARVSAFDRRIPPQNSCTQGKNVHFSTCLRWPVYFIFIPFISLVDKIIFLYFIPPPRPRSKQHQSFLKNQPFFNHRFSPIYCNGWIPVLWPSCPLTQDFPRWSRKKSSLFGFRPRHRLGL